MNKQERKYTEAQIDLLSGKIRQHRYMAEVVAELAKNNRSFSENYISRVITKFQYNNEIWDAALAVVMQREKEKQAIMGDFEQMVTA